MVRLCKSIWDACCIFPCFMFLSKNIETVTALFGDYLCVSGKGKIIL